MATGRAATAQVEALIAEGAVAGGRRPGRGGSAARPPRHSTAPSADPATAELIDRALTLARRVGDPLIESAALDQLMAVQLARGEVRARGGQRVAADSSCWPRCR